MAAVVVIAGVFVYLNTGARLANKQAIQGEKYLAGKQYYQAIGAFEQAISTDKKTAKAYTGLADAYVGLQDTKKAEESLQNGIEASPKADVLYLKLAELYNNNGKPGKAVQTLTKGYSAVKSQNIQTQLKKLQASFINIAGGERVQFQFKENIQTEGDIRNVIGILKDRAVQLGYKDTLIYYGGNDFYVDIIGEEPNNNQVFDLINIQRPIDPIWTRIKMIPPQYDENNLPDEINIKGGLRLVLQVNDQTASIEKIIRSLREYLAQLVYEGTAIYQIGESRIVIDLWGDSDFWRKIGGPDAIVTLLKNQANADIAEKTQISRIH
ncbi:tetratricopeptide repeat protein [Desulfosporosinus metallidurans]|uniref:tetratricopeptide repeat protein n=1 Tax=Desulfosporosinus metallidurans TaxID=1888891 RepID=UPI00147C3DBF|nr:tetratricopeptide repeat protein [Desulfosporosinus metallidurans]